MCVQWICHFFVTSGGVSCGSRSVWCTGIRRLRTCGRFWEVQQFHRYYCGAGSMHVFWSVVICVLRFTVFFVGTVVEAKKRNEACMHMHVSFPSSIKRAKITWNVRTSARSNTWGAKHNETTEIERDSKNHATSTPSHGATLKMQNTIKLRRLGLS